MTVTILLADDHPMIRQGLRNLLHGEAAFKVIDEAADGLEALRKIERCKPDILIVDIIMPLLNGLEVIRQAQKLSPVTRVIVFSMQGAEPYVAEALKAGAVGYILKDAGPAEILNALQSVLQGARYLSAALAERLEAGGYNLEDEKSDGYQTLTLRERQIFQMAATGKTSTEIGRMLSISPRTVELHRSRVLRKLGLRNQSELIRYAIKRGFLPMDE
jgi:DNA-binding NarL/FixJ family response regulator